MRQKGLGLFNSFFLAYELLLSSLPGLLLW